jgi:hypothetical protein
MLPSQKKSIENVRQSPIPTIALLVAASIALSGCSFLFRKPVEPVQVVTKPAEKTPLSIENPQPLRLKSLDWIVITPQNWEEVFSQMQSKDQSLVLFGLTSDGYQALSVTIAELRNLINTQRIIIQKYKDYYEPTKVESSEKK